MNWASSHIDKLADGIAVQFRPSGHSMAGRVAHKSLVTVEPASCESVSVGDVVLCRVAGKVYLHLVKAKDAKGRLLIGNNKGHDNGWTRTVFGKCVKVES